MDNVWDRKSFKVGGHWPLWRGWKKRMTTQNDFWTQTKQTTCTCTHWSHLSNKVVFGDLDLWPTVSCLVLKDAYEHNCTLIFECSVLYVDYHVPSVCVHAYMGKLFRSIFLYNTELIF